MHHHLKNELSNLLRFGETVGRLQDLLPFTAVSALGSIAVVEGFGGGYCTLPLHRLHLQTDQVSGEVAPSD